METTTKNVIEDYHLVLQKYINLILFGRISKPNFTQNNGEIKIQKSLLEFYDLLDIEGQSPEATLEIITSQSENTLLNFRKKIKPRDLINLMHCYGFSSVRTVNKIAIIFNPKKSLEELNNQEQDIDLFNNLIQSTEFPREIKNYLNLQFFDFFSFIPYQSKIITEELYQFLVNRYVRTYDYDKVLNIIYKNYDEIK